MRRALEIIRNARRRMLARPDFDTAWLAGLPAPSCHAAGNCYLVAGHNPHPPQEWPFPRSAWRPSPDRRKILTKAGVCVLLSLEKMAAAGEVRTQKYDPYESTERKLWGILRELSTLLPSPGPHRPCPDAKDWASAEFDKDLLIRWRGEWGCNAHHASVAAVLGMSPLHLRPHLPEGTFNSQAIGETLNRLAVPFTVAKIEGEDNPQPPEHGMIRYSLPLRKGGQTSFLLGTVRGAADTLFAFLPNNGWTEHVFASVGIILLEGILKAKERAKPVQLWTFHLPPVPPFDFPSLSDERYYQESPDRAEGGWLLYGVDRRPFWSSHPRSPGESDLSRDWPDPSVDADRAG